MMAILKCGDVALRAGDYLERRLSWRGGLAMRMHLAMCAACRRFVSQLRQTLVALRDVPIPPPREPSAELPAEFRKQFPGG
jgi:hypothetical protein